MNSVQRSRLITQTGFFVLFVVAPVLDIFRFDLNLGHAIFFGMVWRLGIDQLAAGQISATQAAGNLVLRLFLPLLGVAALVIGTAWKWGRLYCGWLCPHFSVVETINQLLRHATAKQSLWDRHKLPEHNPDGTVTRANPWYWPLVVAFAAAFAFVWAVVLLTYLLPPMEIYGNLWHGSLTRNQGVFIGVGTLLLFIEFMFARHLFCRFACAVGFMQSLAWMGNRKAMVVGFDRQRVSSCTDCNSACDNACPMRIKPRSIKRLMFACTQCGQCTQACTSVQADNPQGSLLKWVEQECALDKSAREFGHHAALTKHCFGEKITASESTSSEPAWKKL